ncbi:MAG: lipoate--protein ligase [Tissierellia bacterium]|nr:lipoate--protein ligase [Tissierellia bacterium]
MMRYIYSPSTDPHWNLALEQYVFDDLDQDYAYFMLWQNDNAIIVGKHQNTAGEINAEYVKQSGIRVVRRLSGGGAVYHDMGNLNYTFIDDNPADEFDFSRFCEPVIKALGSLGVDAKLSGRNDMTIEEKKFSGNASYKKKGRIMQHGTMMFDSNLEVLSNALKVSKDKLASKGVKSVRSRVTNIKPHVKEDLGVQDFIHALRDFMFQENEMEEYVLTPEDIQAVDALRDERYGKWEWNYGQSPEYTVQKEKRIEGFGKLEIYMVVDKGVIEKIRFHGDYFGAEDTQPLADIFIGCQLNEEDLAKALDNVNLQDYFNNLTKEQLLEIMLI